MRYGSVCSGIEAATVAWHPLGWKPAWFSEIEPFPSAVLRHHWPGVENRGDMTRFKEWNREPIDLLVGGTPCQSFSVAGLRKGMDDPRGNLALVYLALADRLRPRWVVWENVPGVLSSGKGRDFGSFVGGLAKLGYGWAGRVLDAQFFGVPQRRRRVFVVGYLGDWRRAAAVLFERESLSGHPAPSRAKGQDLAPTISARVKGGGGLGTDFDCDGGLVTHTLRSDGFDASEDGTGRGTPLVFGFSGESNGSTARNATDLARPIMGRHGDPGFVAFDGQSGVRRLTPRECESLMGFPNDFTLIPYRGKPAADGPRYKALGNSMAVPVVRWIGKRIKQVNDIRGDLCLKEELT